MNGQTFKMISTLENAKNTARGDSPADRWFSSNGVEKMRLCAMSSSADFFFFLISRSICVSNGGKVGYLRAASESFLSLFKISVTSCLFFVIFVTFSSKKVPIFFYFGRKSLLRVPNISFFEYFLFEKFWNNRENLLLLISRFVNTWNFSIASLATFYFLPWGISKKQSLESLPLT